MKRVTYKKTLRGVGLGLAAFGVAALAQQPATQEVKIEANKVVTVTQGQYPNETQKVQFTRIVKYGDLNLATAAGEKELKSRIEGTATQVCEQLGKMFPVSSAPSEMNERATCVQGAVDAAMGQAKLAIAAAHGAKQR